MDICVCKSEIKTEYPDSPTSGHEENNSVQTAGPDIKLLIKTEICDYKYHDSVENEPVKQIVNVEGKTKIEDDSLKHQSNNYNCKLQASLNEISAENLANEMEIKEEKIHFTESLNIGKTLNFDLSNEEIQGLNVESMELDQGNFYFYFLNMIS